MCRLQCIDKYQTQRTTTKADNENQMKDQGYPIKRKI